MGSPVEGAKASGASTAVSAERDTGRWLRRFVTCEWITLIGVMLLLAGDLLQAWNFVTLEGLLRNHGSGSVAAVDGIDSSFELAALLQLAGYAIAWAAFFTAMARARKIAVAAGITGFRYGFVWTVASAFVPIISLYRPYLGFGELRRAIFVSVRSRRGGAAWKSDLGISWATFALAAGQIAGNTASLVISVLCLIDISADADTPPVQSAEYKFFITQIEAAINAVAFGMLLVYLATLLPQLRQLVAPGKRQPVD